MAPEIGEVILQEIKEIRERVDQGNAQGNERSQEIKLLREQLGMDNPYGRLPLIEANVERLEVRANGLEARLRTLELAETLLTGQRVHANQAMSVFWSFVSGSAGATTIAVLAKLLGLIK